MKLEGRYIWIGILCAYFAAVMVLCLIRPEYIPDVEIRIWNIPADKILHFLMFLPYPAIAYIAFRPENRRKWLHLLVLLAVFAAGIGLAMTTEKLQGLSEYRAYEVTDFYADILGMECCTIATALYIIFRRDKKDNR